MIAKDRFTAFVLLAAPLFVAALQGADSGFDYAIFKTPPAEYRGRAMWGYDLSTVTEAQIVSGVQEMAKQRFGGFFVSVNGGNGRNLDPAYIQQASPHFRFTNHGIEYLSDEFFRLYRLAVEEAKKNGLSFVLYDDYEYPTGTVGGQLYMKYPQHMAKRLDMVEKDVAGPATVSLAIPEGTYVGAVLMNRDTHERTDVSGQKTQDNRIECEVPKGNWKLMVFYLNTRAVLKIRNPGLVDCLDEDAMNVFLSLSYEKFYAHLKQYFGSVIKMSFFDEPTLHWLDGRTWTPSFNKNFEKKYGYSPLKNYPALWYDIGPETAAARNALFGFRAQLFADNFVGKIARWCKDHGIRSTGHLDQEEAANPVPINGDLMKVFEHQDIPGHDDIFFLGRSNRGYKVVTSAAFNYDKPVVMAETYAAYTKLDDRTAFQTAMDQYAMGINLQIPSVGINQVKDVVALNDYVGRLSYLLQHGRHVADVAVLYPIAALQACYSFAGGQVPENAKPETDRSVTDLAKAMGPAWEYAYNGGVPPPEIDYMDVGEILYRALRVDYTYLHPEVLENRCVIGEGKLILHNSENHEEYSVLIVPGGNTLSFAAARKIGEFYQKGGTVIATSRLPYLSAEFGRDHEVQKTISEIFGIPADAVMSGDIKIERSAGYLVHRNPAGGRAFFLPKAAPDLLKTVLKQALPIRDVEFREEMGPLEKGRAYAGALTYIHKVKNGRDIYFFANSSEKQVDTHVVLRGRKTLTIWNPHTGEKERATLMHAKAGGTDVTTVRLVLPPVASRFYIQEEERRRGR
jgi:putative intracellular protease/amidase